MKKSQSTMEGLIDKSGILWTPQSTMEGLIDKSGIIKTPK